MPDLLVIADPRDTLATAFTAAAQDAGRDAEQLGIIEAGQRFTIRIDERGSSVEPDLPLFLRVSLRPDPGADSDETFQHGECVSAVWAAAALCRAPVIGRPGAHGFGGRCSPSAVVTEVRGGFHAGRGEVFSRELAAPRDRSLDWWTQSFETLQTARWPDRSHGHGPYRARQASGDDSYEIVSVVRSKTWRATTVVLDHLRLEAESARIAEALELDFAAVTWAISEDLARATVARVDPWPRWEQVRYVWPHIATALLDALTP